MITNYPLLFLSEQLNASRQLHRDRSLTELSSGRRIIINSNSNYPQVSFASNKVNVYIPSISSSLLIQSLTFSLNSRSSLIITGPSGCGKSSLLRLLAGLQYNLTDNSSIYVPSRSSSIFLPQQLYLIEGTLREQLNYLRHAKNMSTCNNDQQLIDLLFKFSLIHLNDRYTLDSSIQLWSRTLSLGEQQRLIIVVALVTLIRASNQDENNQIKHFILDETTAGCDELTEKTIYEYLRSSDVQYISISHRNELIKYHTHQLIINPKNRSYELVEHR
jgi:putative ATP-binding cassette transporter